MANKHRKVWKVVSRKSLSGKQTQPKGKTLSWKPNQIFFYWKMFSVDRKVFPLTGKCFPLTEKCFPLTNFPNGKQTQESLESGFPESEFRETNMASISVYFYRFKKEGIFAQPKDQTTLFYSLFFSFPNHRVSYIMFIYTC